MRHISVIGQWVRPLLTTGLLAMAALNANAQVKLDISVRMLKGEHFYRWRSKVTEPDGTLKATFDQSTFRSRIADKTSMLRARPDYVPALSEDGKIAREVLETMGTGASLQDLANRLVVAYPKKFRAPQEALNLVTKLTLKYG